MTFELSTLVASCLAAFFGGAIAGAGFVAWLSTCLADEEWEQERHIK